MMQGRVTEVRGECGEQQLGADPTLDKHCPSCQQPSVAGDTLYKWYGADGGLDLVSCVNSPFITLCLRSIQFIHAIPEQECVTPQRL
jgi:hypothetical protein